MRRIVLNKPPVARTALGIEDYEIENALPPAEEVESAVEMTEQAYGASSDLEAADTLAARAEALEDLTVVAETTPEASENDVVLTEIISDLATQGTDLTTDQNVVPALESYVGKTISTEGISDTIQRMWKALVELVKSAWEKIKAFFGNVEAQISTMKKKLRDAAKRASDSTVTEAKAKTQGLCIGGKAPGSAADMTKNLADTKDVLNKLLVGYSGVVAKHVDVIEFVFRDLEAQKDGDIGLKMQDSFKTVLASAKTFNNEALLGNVKLELTDVPNEEGLDDSRLVMFKFTAEPDTEIKDAAAFDITVEQKKKVYDECLALLDIVEDFRKNKMPKFEMKFVEKLNSAIFRMAGSVQAAQAKREIDLFGRKAAEAEGFKIAGNAGRATVRLTQSPFTKVVSTTLASVRAHIAALDVEGKGKEVATA